VDPVPPPDSVRCLVQVRINANPGLCRNDVVNGARLCLRKEDDASLLFCTVVGSTVDANGHTHYTLTDEKKKLNIYFTSY